MAPDEPDDDPTQVSHDTSDALAAIRGLGAERAADDEAERTAVPDTPAQQAALALELLEVPRRPTTAERRRLGIARTPDDPAVLPRHVEDREREQIEQLLDRLEPHLVVAAWLDGLARNTRHRTMSRVAGAFARVAHIDGFVGPLRALLTSAVTSVRHLIRDLFIASGRDDEVLVDMLRAIVDDEEVSRHVAEDALRVAAPIAARSQAAAVLIAARIRRDRSQRIADALSALPLDERVAAARAVASHALADIVTATRSPRLTASATLELERAFSPGEREQWAQALLACDPAGGRAYLARMRHRPGWGGVLGELPPPEADPLADLTSPIADVRRRALDTLSRAPRRDHVQALLLAMELDMYVTREIEKTSWPTLQAPKWLHLLVAYAPPSPATAFFARVPPVTEIHVLYARILLDKLVEEDRARRPFAEPQRLTPALRDLAVRGVAAYATDVAALPLDAAALAELEAREAEIIARG